MDCMEQGSHARQMYYIQDQSCIEAVRVKPENKNAIK